MKRIQFMHLILFCLCCLPGCKGCRVPESRDNGQMFMSHTYKGRPVAFTCVEQGAVAFTAEDLANMDKVDAWGHPVYFTEDLIHGFTPGSDINAGDGQGLCIRFVVPPIEPGDYVILQADVLRPHTAENTERLWSSYQYDYRNSGKTEYIWFLFPDGAADDHQDGAWTMQISAAGQRLWSASFSVKK